MTLLMLSIGLLDEALVIGGREVDLQSLHGWVELSEHPIRGLGAFAAEASVGRIDREAVADRLNIKRLVADGVFGWHHGGDFFRAVRLDPFETAHEGLHQGFRSLRVLLDEL